VVITCPGLAQECALGGRRRTRQNRNRLNQLRHRGIGKAILHESTTPMSADQAVGAKAREMIRDIRLPETSEASELGNRRSCRQRLQQAKARRLGDGFQDTTSVRRDYAGGGTVIVGCGRLE
jgi:hypothetical protein